MLAGQAEPGSLGRPFELALDALGLDAVPEATDRLAAVVQAYLDRVGNGPALVIFEDLHWADAESLGVFERLASGTPPGRCSIGSYRSDELSRMLPCGRSARAPRSPPHRASPVARPADRSRRSRTSSRACTDERSLRGPPPCFTARTGGNPFFLEEILSAAGDADPECLATQPLPFTLAEIVRRQLDGLSGDERRVIDAASVLGRGASFDVLAAVTRMTEQEMIGHLRGLVDRGLITEDRPDEFVFRHALVRDAVEDQLLGRERRRLHEAALAALARVGERRHRGAREARAGRGSTTTSSSTSRRRAPPTTSSGARRTKRCASRPTRSPRTPTASRCSRPRRERRGLSVSTTKRSVTLGDGVSVPKRAVTSSRKPRPRTWWRAWCGTSAASTSTTRRSPMSSASPDSFPRVQSGRRRTPRWRRRTCSLIAASSPSSGQTARSKRPSAGTRSRCGRSPWSRRVRLSLDGRVTSKRRW